MKDKKGTRQETCWDRREEKGNRERDSTMDTVFSVDNGDTAKNCDSTATVCYSCEQWGHMAKSCPEKGKGMQAGKGWWRSQKGKGKGKGLQSMSEWDEWDQTEDYTSVPISSMSCGERQSETNPADQWQVLVKRVKSTCVKTRAGKRQFVRNNKFEAIAEHEH